MRQYMLLLVFAVTTAVSQPPSLWPGTMRNPFANTVTTAALQSTLIPLQYIDPKELAAIIKDQRTQLLSVQAAFIVQEKDRPRHL